MLNQQSLIICSRLSLIEPCHAKINLQKVGASTCSWITGLTNQNVEDLGLVSMDNFFLTKIICHRNFDNEFALTHSKDYLYYLARSPLSQIV